SPSRARSFWLRLQPKDLNPQYLVIRASLLQWLQALLAAAAWPWKKVLDQNSGCLSGITQQNLPKSIHYLRKAALPKAGARHVEALTCCKPSRPSVSDEVLSRSIVLASTSVEDEAITWQHI